MAQRADIGQFYTLTEPEVTSAQAGFSKESSPTTGDTSPTERLVKRNLISEL